MIKGFAAFSIVIGLITTPLANAEIYRWVDEQGNIHFGDCPPADCEAAAVPSTAEPSAAAVREARERAKRLQEYQRQMSESRRNRTAESRPAQDPSSLARIPSDLPCFSSLSNTWDDLIPDVRGNVQRRPLKGIEYGWLKRLLRSLEGRRDGFIRETVCIRPDASPPSELRQYEVDWHATWRSDRVFRVKADLRGLETGVVDVEYLSYLLSRDGLRFRKMGSDKYFQLDLPGNDAEIVELAKDRLTFFWRRASKIRRTTVMSLRCKGRRIVASEFFYAQGVLSGKRHWEIGH